ncbi:MAG: FHA domain-containing protein [Thermoguttaceae bacterium]|jgi:pSer/pThr/pTyr-binding forkhead associated (FHA) protein|nr:FHA domain-containing protein [Thermoguttaceae bacterium]MBR5759944.1 FHA domain-containing protein [Thermoguttaceae bacterium]
MEIKLTILSDEKQYFSQTLSLPCVIGRGRQCGVAILHPVVSRQHCEIYEQDGKVFVRDLGSLNGTVFEGVRIGRGVNVPFGGEFSIGRLFFKIDRPDALDDVDDLSAHSSVDYQSAEALRREMDKRVANTLDKVLEDEKQPVKIETNDDSSLAGANSDSILGVELDDLASEEF